MPLWLPVLIGPAIVVDLLPLEFGCCVDGRRSSLHLSRSLQQSKSLDWRVAFRQLAADNAVKWLLPTSRQALSYVPSPFIWVKHTSFCPLHVSSSPWHSLLCWQKQVRLHPVKWKYQCHDHTSLELNRSHFDWRNIINALSQQYITVVYIMYLSTSCLCVAQSSQPQRDTNNAVEECKLLMHCTQISCTRSTVQWQVYSKFAQANYARPFTVQ